MLQLQCEIRIGRKPGKAWFYDYVHDLQVVEDVDSFTRTARIVIPQPFDHNTDQYGIQEEFKVGDPITIELGYWPNMELKFKGYVTKKTPVTPMVITCEDESFLYKQGILTPSTLIDTTLGELIGAYYKGESEIYQPDTKIGDWDVGQFMTFVKLLDELKKKIKITAYWDNDGILRINDQFRAVSEIGDRLFYYDDKKLANIISIRNMDFQQASEYPQVVRAVSEQTGEEEPIVRWIYYDDNQEPIADAKEPISLSGGGAGNVNNFNINYIGQADLDKLAIDFLKNLNFTGFRGAFTTFGEPAVQVNDDLAIYNQRYLEMQGRYRVRSVRTEFGKNGFRQSIQVARKTGEAPAEYL